MTTTTDKIRTRIIALRDRARHANTPAPEAETAWAMARKLCTKHGVDPAILDAAPEPQRTTDPFGFGSFVKKYPCRFGCPAYTQHTIEELNECAAKARARGDNSYQQASQQSRKQQQANDWFADFMRDWAKGNTRSSSSDDEFFTDRHGRTRQHQARATGSHAYCDHPATKSARAKCRRERGY